MRPWFAGRMGAGAPLACALALLLAAAGATLRSGSQAGPAAGAGPAGGAGAAAGAGAAVSAGAGAIAITAGAAPNAGAPADAPPAFDHRIHVTDNRLDCQLCHAYARRGPVAGLPPLARCVGCHRFVAPERPAVAELLARFEAGAPVAWPRVHHLPEYVRFTHKRHVRAGVACSVCHGDVGAMPAVEQVAPLTMGWCVGCHEQRGAPDDCLTCHY